MTDFSSFLNDINETFPLEELRNQAIANKIPVISLEALSLCRFFIRTEKSQTILEVGTAVGYSALCFSHFTNHTAHITTLELSKPGAAEARKNFSFYQPNNIELIEADARQSLTLLQEQKKTYDFIFIDARKEHYWEYFEKSLPLLNNHGLMLFDNCLFHQEALQTTITSNRGQSLRSFNERLLNNTSVHACLLNCGDGVMLVKKV